MTKQARELLVIVAMIANKTFAEKVLGKYHEDDFTDPTARAMFRELRRFKPKDDHRICKMLVHFLSAQGVHVLEGMTFLDAIAHAFELACLHRRVMHGFETMTCDEWIDHVQKEIHEIRQEKPMLKINTS